ncbi:MAG: HAD-IIIC family phosphatase [Burkholderiaceae bacterium]|nr:HAD-IIIC family phosphatase [Burkholderiaceae bacterium]
MSLPQLRAELAAGCAPATPAQAQQVASHARSLAPQAPPLRLAFVHTYTSDLLEPWLALAAAAEGLDHRSYHAPYGLALQEADSRSMLVAHRPHVTVLLLQREDLHPRLARPVEQDQAAQIAREGLQRAQEIISGFRAHDIGHLVVTFLPRLAPPVLGLFETQAEVSESKWWAGFKTELGRWLRNHAPASLLLDLDDALSDIGREAFFDRRFWYSARFPFGAAGARDVARRIVAVGAAKLKPKAKVLVLDADNTLWGGIVGEDGIDGIQLGPDYPGNAYMDLQRRVLDFQQRGLIVAMCSKNNPADVAQVLEQHPHMVLRDRDFAARRVNWLPKPANLRSLAEELNLGLESFIFVDDSPHECEAVRQELPQVEVVQVPARPAVAAQVLDQVARLEVLSLTAEDFGKTGMYAQERLRRELQQEAQSSGGDYLSRLGMRMSVHLDAPTHLARLAQLTQKTNQFNLTTRRYDEARLNAYMHSSDWSVFDFSLSDVFGNSGTVGLALIERERNDARSARIDSFLMSCRVIGRQAESAFLHAVMRRLAADGVVQLAAEYLPTPKNELVKDFLASEGFQLRPDGRWLRDLVAAPPHRADAYPIEINGPERP